MLRDKSAISPIVATIILIAVAVTLSLAVGVWAGALRFTVSDATESMDIKIVYSNDGKVVLVRIPHDMDSAGEMQDMANVIADLLAEGYEYRGMFQSDTGVGAAHFRDYLIFEKEAT